MAEYTVAPDGTLREKGMQDTEHTAYSIAYDESMTLEQRIQLLGQLDTEEARGYGEALGMEQEGLALSPEEIQQIESQEAEFSDAGDDVDDLEWDEE